MAFEPRERLRSSQAALIYKGVDEMQGGEATLKIFKDPYGASKAFADALDQVASPLKYIHHPNIVRVLEVGKKSDRLAVATEVVPLSLGDVLQAKEALELAKALSLMLKVLEGLEAGYQEGLPHHLDLKPNNILLDTTLETVKVGDWYMAHGMAAVEPDLRKAWQDPRYLAPEQIHGIGGVSEATDLYQCGLLLYHLLTGFPLFQGADEEQVRYQQVYASPQKHIDYYTGIPQVVRDILATALAKDPGRRFQTVAQMREALAYALAASSFQKAIPADSLVGQTIGDKWRIVEDLGHGHFAETYKALEVGRETPVTIKVFAPGLSAEEGFVKAINKDLYAQTTLQHPHITNLIASGWHQGRFYIVRNFLPVNLGQVLAEEGRLGPEQALRVVRKILGILEYLYRKGGFVAHQQLAPAHILINPAGEDFWLTDFRLEETSRFIRSRYGIPLSTYRYMAPELWADDASRIGPPTDIYALGALLYELVVGEPLFRGEDPKEVEQEHLAGNPKETIDSRQEIPLVFHDLLSRMLARESNDRYQTYQALLDDIVALVGDSERGSAGLQLIDAGTTVKGKFLLEERLPLTDGPGAPAVYKGVHTQTETPVMLWFYKRTRTKDLELAFQQVMDQAQTFDHPSILRVLDHGHDKGAFYYVSELRTTPLATALESQGPLMVEQACELAKQIAQACQVMEQRGRDCHGALSPQTIFLQEKPEFRAKLAGLEKRVLAATPLEANLPPFLAPEQITGLGRLAGPTDQYALAHLLVYFLTGEPLLSGEPAQIHQQHVFGDLPTLLNSKEIIPQGLRRLLVRMMERDATARYPDWGEFLDDLDDFLAAYSGGAPEQEALSFLIGSATYQTLISREEDRASYVVRMPHSSAGIRGIFALAQGVGEPADALIAQNRVVEELERTFSPSRLQQLDFIENPMQLIEEGITRANGVVNQEAFRLNRLGKLGAELLLGIVTRDRLYLGRVGGAFAYVFRAQSIRSFLRKPVDQRVLGKDMTVQFDSTERHLRPGDTLVLGTGNLSRMLADVEMRNIAVSTLDSQESAERIVSLASSRSKGQPQYQVGMAVLVAQFGDVTAESVMRAKRGFQSGPVIHVYTNRGQAFLDEGNLDAAIAEFQKAVEISPDNFTANFKLAQVYFAKGQLDQARRLIGNALSLMPNFVEGHILLGDIYYRKGKREQAKDEYYYAIQVGEKNSHAWQALGRFYYQEALYSDAAGAFQKAVELDPRNEEAKAHLALTERKKRSLGGMLSEQGAKTRQQIAQPFKRTPKPGDRGRKR
ncbi:MAG TPA: protein kinase [bacterium]|nr:protein kinase [bacterium]